MPSTQEAQLSSLERIANLLAILVIKDIEDTEQQAMFLSGAGFGSIEISKILGVSPNYLNVIKHRRKSKKKRKKSSR